MKSYRQNKQNRPRNSSNRKNRNIIHNKQNLDQQQNMVSTRNTNKIRDVKLPKKYFYDTGYQIPIVIGGSITPICQMTQGIRATQRIGDKIVVRRIEMKYIISTPPTDVYNQSRILLVYSPYLNITLGQVLDSNLATGQIDPLSYTKPYSTGTTHQVLHDQVHIGNVNSSNAAVHGEISIPVNLPSTWDFGQVFESGYICLILLGDSTISPNPQITYNIRSVFSDL